MVHLNTQESSAGIIDSVSCLNMVSWWGGGGGGSPTNGTLKIRYVAGKVYCRVVYLNHFCFATICKVEVCGVLGTTGVYEGESGLNVAQILLLAIQRWITRVTSGEERKF